MKIKLTLIISILLVLINFSCKDEKEHSNRIFITGQVLHYDNYPDYQIVELFFPNPFTTIFQKNAYLDNNDEFRFEWELTHPQDFFLRFGGMLPVFISPGDSLHINIDAKVLDYPFLLDAENIKRSEVYEFYKVTGTAEKMNQDIIQFYSIYYDSLIDWETERNKYISLSPADYKKYLLNRNKKEIDFLKNFIKDFECCNLFENWATNFFKYSLWDDLMRYRWLHPKYNDIEIDTFQVPGDYYDFLANFNMNDENAMMSSMYYRFIHEYYNYITNYNLREDSADILKEYYESKEYNAAYSMIERQIRQNSAGFVQKVLLTKLYSFFLEWNDIDLFEYFYKPELVGRDDFNKLLDEQYQSLKIQIENPQIGRAINLHNHVTNTNLDILDSIIDSNFKKILYIDFWAPWCGPCISEIPYIKNIQKEFKDKDIVFIFLASRCTDKSWKATISENQLVGEHYLLTDDQYAFLSERFKFTGIPHYLIINKKGGVAYSNAPRPSEKEKLIKVLNELLD